MNPFLVSLLLLLSGSRVQSLTTAVIDEQMTTRFYRYQGVTSEINNKSSGHLLTLKSSILDEQ